MICLRCMHNHFGIEIFSPIGNLLPINCCNSSIPISISNPHEYADMCC